MEENKVNEIQAEEAQNQNTEPTPKEQNVAEQGVADAEAATENAVEATPAVEPKAENAPAEPKAENAPAEPTKRVAKKKPVKVVKTSFGKMFLAGLLAVIVGSVLSFFIMIGLFSSVSAFMTPTPTTVPETAILKIDFAESIVDLPSSNPMAAFDIMSMTQNSSISLYKTLRLLTQPPQTSE